MKRHNSLKPLNGLDFEKGDVCEVIFSHKKTVKACRLFMEWLKTVAGECNRSELSQFARDLANGHVQDGFTYRRSNFYRTILRRFVALGFISLQPRWEEGRYVHKYASVYQPIPKRVPLGGRSFWGLAWEVAKKWNEECER